ncbi:MAG TPA: protein kinase [Bacteroidota bacterium]|nr:protein kinase [Bacteroidota bacterium]
MTEQMISHYRIDEKLGEGGMGVVYRAVDVQLDRQVAIKVLSPHLSSSEEGKARFVQEAKAAAALNHPNILSVYEIGQDNGSLYFAMEFVPGQTLKSYIAGRTSGPGMPVQQALDWAVQIAQGLAAAHDKGIVHRDIKPENIMVTGDDKMKIMDFGIAKLAGSSGLTRTRTSLGTLSYMSPEQAKGETADHRSDIWALGVVLFEMLTGEVPFKAEHEAALLYLIANEEPPLPSAFDRKIPAQVDTLLRGMLEKDRDRRIQTARAVKDAIGTVRHELEAAAGVPKTKAIAVLPFDNISPEKENDYFSDGLTEEIIANLSRLKNMRVISRTTTMQYKGAKKDIKTIGRELGARYIMEGSVRKFQDNLRITAQLIDVDTDAQLWAETYKGKLADVFDIQEQVSKQIVDALMLKLTPTEKIVLTKRATLNPEAFDCNLRARNFLYRRTKNSLQFAIQLFLRAIELDPRYAAAYAGLGEAYASLFQDFERKEIWLSKAIESGLKALMYDATLSEAYAALGLAYLNTKALEDAVTASRKAIELDPNNFIGYWILGRIYHTTDRDPEAVGMFQKVLALNPDFYSAGSDLYIVYMRLGEKDKAEEMLKKNIEIYPRYLSQHPDDARGHMFYAIDLVLCGRNDEAKSEAAKALELNPSDPLMLYNAACFYAQMGERQLALQSLRNAIIAGYENFDWAQRDPDLDAIRDDPSFAEMMRRQKS